MNTNKITVDVDALAEEIRRVDGKHELGAAALAEALMPFIQRHREQVGEAVAWLVNRVHSEGKGALCDDPKLLEAARELGCIIEPLYTTPPLPQDARELMGKAAAHFDSLIRDIDNPYDNALHYCAEYLRALIPTEKEPS